VPNIGRLGEELKRGAAVKRLLAIVAGCEQFSAVPIELIVKICDKIECGR
jgi:hypothetical protein